MQICDACARADPGTYRLCGYCGTELVPGGPAPEIRRTVTFVTSDLKGSTALAERLDPESLREALVLYFNVLQLVLESHGGTEGWTSIPDAEPQQADEAPGSAGGLAIPLLGGRPAKRRHDVTGRPLPCRECRLDRALSAEQPESARSDTADRVGWTMTPAYRTCRLLRP